MILFFGDSITSGENNKFKSYVEKLNLKDSINLGVSGTCIGNYSIYPVGETNLIQLLYKETKRIKQADKIFLEYGSNDISSICLGYTSLNTILIELNKCLDLIKQTNPKCEIYFLLLGENIKTFCLGQINYLKNDYLKDISTLVFPSTAKTNLTWLANYKKFSSLIKKMIPNTIEFPLLGMTDLEQEQLHPNNKGYEKIAAKIKQEVKF